MLVIVRTNRVSTAASATTGCHRHRRGGRAQMTRNATISLLVTRSLSACVLNRSTYPPTQVRSRLRTLLLLRIMHEACRSSCGNVEL